jgi:hypothetical protein
MEFEIADFAATSKRDFDRTPQDLTGVQKISLSLKLQHACESHATQEAQCIVSTRFRSIPVGWETTSTNIADLFTKVLDTAQRREKAFVIQLCGGRLVSAGSLGLESTAPSWMGYLVAW